MHDLNKDDNGQKIDWGLTSDDYSEFRPGPPLSLYKKLAILEVGLPQQRVLDLGTGTGVVARQLARQGCEVFALDLSPQQIATAKNLAQAEGLQIDFRVTSAENTPFGDNRFDLASASQCWLYFDTTKVIAELKRVLRPQGLLVTMHTCWLPRQDRIARATEELVRKHNPKWSAYDYSGIIPAMPEWAKRDFILKSMFFYDEEISFSRTSWRGRIRSCRGIGASLSSDQVERFDQELDELLKGIADENFNILHRIDAHILQLR